MIATHVYTYTRTCAVQMHALADFKHGNFIKLKPSSNFFIIKHGVHYVYTYECVIQHMHNAITVLCLLQNCRNRKL